MNLKDLIHRLDDDNFGQTFYVVDSDFRTGQAQGWSKDDGTGPINMVEQRRPGYVHVTPGGRSTAYGSDAAAIQGAVDAAVDFRGDKVFLTPGSYSIATAISLDCPTLRLMGPKREHPRQAVVTVTAAVDDAYNITAAGDDMEIAYHTLIPLTAKNTINHAAGADRGYLHHLFWDATGITGSTSTEFFNGAGSKDWLVEKCSFYVDAAQGDAFTIDSPLRWIWRDCDFTVGLTGIAWASVFTFATSALGNLAQRCVFTTAGGATPAVFTKIFTGIANVNGQLFIHDCRVNGTSVAAGTDIETTFGTATDIDLAENYLSGDATTEGGTLLVLA